MLCVQPTELRCLQLAVSSGGEHPVGVVGEIFRDVNRTFPWHPMFGDSQQGQHTMFDALRAYASANIDVGYCQGMNYVAGFLVVKMNPGWVKGSPLRSDTGDTVVCPAADVCSLIYLLVCSLQLLLSFRSCRACLASLVCVRFGSLE